MAPAAVDGLWNFDVTMEQNCDLAQVSYGCGMINPLTEELVEPPNPDCRPPDEGEQRGETPPDDLAFLEDVVDSVGADYAIDARRVYLAGASYGGWMASRAGCARSDRFAAVAAMTNTMWYIPGCEAEGPVSIIGIGGSDDIYHPVCLDEVYAARWAEHNGCAASPVEEEVGDGVRRIWYPECVDNASVVVYDAPGLWLYPAMDVPAGFEPLRTIWEFLATQLGD